MAGKKSGRFDKQGIERLAKDKPVVYTIKDRKGKNVYTGVAKRGRVEERLKEHLPGSKDPVRGGKRVVIRQKSSIDEARKSEARIIKREMPPQNKKGKFKEHRRSGTRTVGKGPGTNSGGPRKI